MHNNPRANKKHGVNDIDCFRKEIRIITPKIGVAFKKNMYF
jgi:hypothetical protein